eukprot:TRINITY_DN2044_c0_g1_i1.p1 TRINITY_DN2044_c0_g1~~TRINITY_DN2044_c0_g1_i1.p1  ORF type:complete len:496 (+),score=141.35 TRINITY_DN2044_c0_g1_i1:84-1490(+)
MAESNFSIQLISARNLAPMDKSGTSDPYCRVTASFNKQSFKTRTIDKTLNPHWGETFSFFVPPGADGHIIIKVWDKDRWTKDDFLGDVVIDIAKYADGNARTEWHPINNEPKKKSPEKAALQARCQWERSDRARSSSSAPAPAGSAASAASPSSSSSTVPVASSPAAPAKAERLEEVYTMGKELGRGGFSIVRLATHTKTGEQVAVKCINKRTIQPNELAMLGREIQIMQKLRHKNIIQLIDKYETPTELFLVLELVNGGELFDKIVEKGFYSEEDAAKLVYQILDGVSYMHRHGVVHRDLKPENLLCAGKDGEVCKIADFGLSKDMSTGNLQTSCGTPSYVAPEVLSGGTYDAECDLWSVGVITYVLLCGFTPFYGETQRELFDRITRADYSFPSPEWDEISPAAKDFVKKVLLLNPHERLSAQNALEHPWLKPPVASVPSARKLVSLNSVRDNLIKLNAMPVRPPV